MTAALLWRPPAPGPDEAHSSSPGPKPSLTVDRVVSAAIAVADTDPAAGVAMRAVADRLGVTAMALYGYVPSKNALVSLAYDAIHAEMPDQATRQGDWRERIIAWAKDLVGLYVRHPWALRVPYARPVLGPNEQGVLESLVGSLRPTNLDTETTRRVTGLIFHAVRGTADTIAAARNAEAETGITEEEWWQTSSSIIHHVVPDFGCRFPNTVWLLSQASTDPELDNGSGYVERQSLANFRVGLDVLLDGVEAAVT